MGHASAKDQQPRISNPSWQTSEVVPLVGIGLSFPTPEGQGKEGPQPLGALPNFRVPTAAPATPVSKHGHIMVDHTTKANRLRISHAQRSIQKGSHMQGEQQVRLLFEAGHATPKRLGSEDTSF